MQTEVFYKDLKLRTATQHICAEISIYKPKYNNVNEVLLDNVKRWLRDIKNDEVHVDQFGYIEPPFVASSCKGDKETCQNAAYNERFWERERGSSTRNAYYSGLWKKSWKVLPADSLGNWIPTKSMIAKAIKEIEAE